MARLSLRGIDTTGADATNDTPRFNPSTGNLEYQPGGGGSSGAGVERGRGVTLPPALTKWTSLGTLLKNDKTWRNQYAGIGMDVAWDPATGKYAMIYCGSQTGGTTTFGLAYSDDGDTWTDYGSNPIFGANSTAGQPDSGGVTFPQLIRHQGLWYLYYIGFPNAGYEQGTPKICYATASSLLGPWTRHGAILTPTDFGSSFTVCYRPTVVRVGDTWYMFTNAGPAAGTEDVYWSSASDPAGPWTVGGKALAAGAVTSGQTVASDPEVIHCADYWLMLVWNNTGIHAVWCDEANFPAGPWTPLSGALAISGTNPRRPVWFQTPFGPRLLINNNNSVQIDEFVPAPYKVAIHQLPAVSGSTTDARLSSLLTALQAAGLLVNGPVTVSDSFNRADGALGTTDTGQTWVFGGGTGWAVATNQAKWTGTSDGLAVVDSGLSDNYTIQFTLVTVNGTWPASVIVRGSSTALGSYTKVYRDNSLGKWRLQTGTGTPVDGPASANPAAGDVLKAVMASGTLTLYVNGTSVGSWTGAVAGTKQGMMGAGNLQLIIDDFTIAAN